MKNEIAEKIFEQANERLKYYLEVKDKLLDNDYFELAGDLFKVAQFIKGANELIINKKFNAFLKGFSEVETPTEKQIEKLIDYIDDESKADFISDTFTKILLSNSSKACLVMGTLLKSMVDEGGNLEHEKLVCIAALRDFFDVDLKNYISFFDYHDYHHAKTIKIDFFKSQDKYRTFNLNKLKKFADEKGISHSSMLLTLEKAINSQLINRYFESDIDVDYDAEMEQTDVRNNEVNEYYGFSSSGKILYQYTKRISS